MHNLHADDELAPVIGERYLDVLAMRAIALLADWDTEPSVTRSKRAADSGQRRCVKARETIVEGIKRQSNGSAGAGERRRRAELAKIHLQAKQLGLDTDTYRDVLHLIAGVTSAADLDAAGRRRVIDHFNSKLGVQRSGAPHNLCSKPLLAKIGALLADGDKPWTYAEALARRICHRDRLAFCSDAELRKIVAALAYDQQRRQRREGSPSCA